MEKKFKKSSPKVVQSVYSFWGKHPLFYAAQDYITFMGKPNFIRKKAVSELNLKKGDKVLEIACGTGRNFPFLIKALGVKGKLVGVDYSEEMLNSAKNFCKHKGWNNVKLLSGDAAKINIEEKNFKAILCVLGISAMENWIKVLYKCKGFLGSNGKLVVCDAQLFSYPLQFLNPLVANIYSNFAAWDPHKNIPKKIEEIFGNIKIQYFNLETFFIASAIKKD